MEDSVTLIRIDVSLTSSLRYLGSGSSLQKGQKLGEPLPSLQAGSRHRTVSRSLAFHSRRNPPRRASFNKEAEVQNDPLWLVKGWGLRLCVFPVAFKSNRSSEDTGLAMSHLKSYRPEVKHSRVSEGYKEGG